MNEDGSYFVVKFGPSTATFLVPDMKQTGNAGCLSHTRKGINFSSFFKNLLHRFRISTLGHQQFSLPGIQGKH